MKPQQAELTGWEKIAEFLGQPVNVAQRWKREGMPVTKEGRYVVATPEQLNAWLGRESAGEPVQIATENIDLAAELKRGLSFVKKQHKGRKFQLSMKVGDQATSVTYHDSYPFQRDGKLARLWPITAFDVAP